MQFSSLKWLFRAPRDERKYLMSVYRASIVVPWTTFNPTFSMTECANCTPHQPPSSGNHLLQPVTPNSFFFRLVLAIHQAWPRSLDKLWSSEHRLSIVQRQNSSSSKLSTRTDHYNDCSTLLILSIVDYIFRRLLPQPQQWNGVFLNCWWCWALSHTICKPFYLHLFYSASYFPVRSRLLLLSSPVDTHSCTNLHCRLTYPWFTALFTFPRSHSNIVHIPPPPLLSVHMYISLFASTVWD